jgi:hypothetical protein
VQTGILVRSVAPAKEAANCSGARRGLARAPSIPEQHPSLWGSLGKCFTDANCPIARHIEIYQCCQGGLLLLLRMKCCFLRLQISDHRLNPFNRDLIAN